jgi:Glycosyl hydrolases family 6
VSKSRPLSLSFLKRSLASVAVSGLAAGALAAPAHAQIVPAPDAIAHAVSSVYSFANTDGYLANEDVGNYQLIINRTNATEPGVICWGVTNKSDEAGANFTKISKQHVDFAAGQTSATVEIPIHDQGINGPAKFARAYLYGCGLGGSSATPNETITLLQNDSLEARDPSNVLGYAPPTNGDPLQNVDWYIFGGQIAAGQAAQRYKHSKPAWSKAFSTLADTPGSGSWRFWMWSQPTKSIATTVEKWFADAEQAQPGTTVQMTMYNLVHGNIEPSKIRSRYEHWITQFAKGLGNNRAVIYLEEDALITMTRVSPSQRTIREAEIAYAVKALESDPHVVVYIDAGASDTLITPHHYAQMLKASDVAQAQGFSVNTTHHEWVTSEIHFGQQISRYLHGAHFVVQTGSAGRGPHLNAHPKTEGVEDLCDPSGTGLGPLTWNTGYKGVDGLLWYANVGFTANIPCHDGAPGLATFWPPYAFGIVHRRVNTVTGPKVPLIKSSSDM